MNIEEALSLRDLSDPSAGPHAIQLVASALEASLAAVWPIEVRRDPGPRIVSIADNYDRLGYRSDAVTRERRYTRYVDSGHMLRSHTTARIPALLDQLAAEPPSGDVLLTVPGMCYRRDAIGRGHVGEPHQMDLWVIRPAGPALAEADLEEMIGILLTGLLPGQPWHTVPSVHPYTVAGREIYVDSPGGPVEVGECGLAHPAVVGSAGSSGLAMGLGLDRLTMLAKGMDDIRLLRSTDPRISRQLLDLSPYQPVSAMPAIRRDMSVVVASDTYASSTDGAVDVDLIGDRIRDLLGPDARSVEEVSVLSQTSYPDLPDSARRRMGVRPGQTNILVRVVLRDLDRTLTAAQANVLRDRVYAGLHEGDVAEWATESTLASP
jgi:phenylalanyl-tRNA synthetase alpha chain